MSESREKLEFVAGKPTGYSYGILSEQARDILADLLTAEQELAALRARVKELEAERMSLSRLQSELMARDARIAQVLALCDEPVVSRDNSPRSSVAVHLVRALLVPQEGQ